MKTVKVTTENKVSVIDVDFNDFRSIQHAIGGHMELVHTRKMYDYFEEPIEMIVDEEGLLKGLPINVLGSWLYGTESHGHPIVGDIVFALPSGPDLFGLEDVENIKEKLLKDFGFLEVDNG